MKKLFGVFMLFVAAFALAACGGKQSSKLFIEGRSHYLLEEEPIELKAILATDDEEVAFDWVSSNPKVVEVAAKTEGDEIISQFGIVKPKKLGKATITVTAYGEKSYKAKLKVQVKDKLVQPESVELIFPKNTPVEQLFIDDEVQLKAKVLPKKADQQIIWSSSDAIIAEVGANGLVTAKVNGGTTITASAAGAKAFEELSVSASQKLTVKSFIDIKGDTETFVGTSVQLTATVNDLDNYKAEVKWSSSNPTVAEVNEDGLVTPKSIGKAVITATAEAKKAGKNDRSVLYPIEVLTTLSADELAGGEAGMKVSFKYADSNVKAQILAALERHLINSGASIPIVSNSGAVLYSERVTLKTIEYVPIMGYGVYYATFADDGLGFRTYTTDDPKTFNHLMYKDSIESDMMSLTELSLFSLEFVDNDEDGFYDGYAMRASAAAKYAEPVEFNEKTGNWEVVEDFDPYSDTFKAWKISLREDLFWVDKNGQKKEQIKADDFIYTYRMALDPVQQNSRANYFYSQAGLPIKNAERYFKQLDSKGEAHAPGQGNMDGNYEHVNWSEVGVHKVDDFAFILELEQPYLQWDIHYNSSGFLYAPVYKPLFEAGFDAKREKTNYGTNLDRYMSSGYYYINYWETGKEYRFIKNPHYTYNEGCLKRTPEKVTFTIVKDSNAALELFEDGKLDSVSIPATHYDQYKNNEGLRIVPGATSFRFTVNRMTQAESDLKWGIGAWKVKPILQEDAFMWALYFAMDRKYVAEDIGKTLTPEQFYYTNAYAINPYTGDPYRETEEAKKVATGVFPGDINLSPGTNGINKGLATEFYVDALDNMIAKGIISADKKTVLEVEIAAFDSVTWTNILDFLADDLANTFNAQTKYPNIEIKFIPAPQPGMNVYYEKQMKGRFDLALAGISGGLLDPIGFMECFCDDDRSGLMLSWGFNSHVPEVLINLDLDGDGELDGEKYWSFDALYAACAGEVFVKMGVEAEAPKDE